MFDPTKGPPSPTNAKLVKCGSYSLIELEATGTLLAGRKLDHYIINNKQVVVRKDHLPFVQAFNSYQPGLTKAKKNLSGTCGAQHQASPGPQPPLWCTWTPCPITRSTLQSPWAQIR